MPFRTDGSYFNGPDALSQRGTVQRAIDRGQSIEAAPADVLQIDIDGPEAYERFEVLLNIWNTCPTLPALGKIVERASRTAGHKHITIELPTEYGVEHRIMLQALLGSDLKRELLSLASYYNGHESPIVFYRPQEEGHAVTPTGPRDGADRTSRNTANVGTAAVPPRRRRRSNGGGSLRGASFTSQFLDDLASDADITF
jgi:hypothetical protein